jgi:hypothetical protein
MFVSKIVCICLMAESTYGNDQKAKSKNCGRFHRDFGRNNRNCVDQNRIIGRNDNKIETATLEMK